MTIKVTVAIPTFRRNHHLVELIPMLVEEMLRLESNEDVDAECVIIDNDPDGGAAELVSTLDARAVRYVHEPRPGLASVRNRALDEASQSHLLAFMDDDGRPDEAWLLELVRTWIRHGCAAVAGRVVEQYERPPGGWIVAGGFFRRRSLDTGTSVAAAPAGNLLIDVLDVQRRGLRFDERFGLSGGEDTLFTRQISATGGRIIWCEESRVVDQVPASRLSRRWVLHRAWSHGNTTALVEAAVTEPGGRRVRVRVRSLLGGVIRMAAGIGRWLIGLVLGSEHHQAKGLRTAYKGAGMSSGSLGHVVEEYGR